MTRLHPGQDTAAWPATLGLATILALTAAASWRLRGEPGASGDAEAPAPASGTAMPLRFKVAGDGSIAVEGEGTTIGLDGVAGRLAGLGPGQPVELVVDPGTPGAAVDALLGRLRDAGVSRCTLIVDRTKATVGTSTPLGTEAGGERKEVGP